MRRQPLRQPGILQPPLDLPHPIHLFRSLPDHSPGLSSPSRHLSFASFPRSVIVWIKLDMRIKLFEQTPLAPSPPHRRESSWRRRMVWLTGRFVAVEIRPPIVAQTALKEFHELRII